MKVVILTIVLTSLGWIVLLWVTGVLGILWTIVQRGQTIL